MSRSTKANRKKGSYQKWYYDSCTIENTSTYEKILKQKAFGNESIISHLGVGEAFANIFRKKGSEAVSDFVNLYSRMVKTGLKVVGNDDIDVILRNVSEMFPNLSVTDAIHLATSIKWKCNLFITSDHHFDDLKKGEVRKLGKKFGISSLKIKKVDYK